ncbi:MAG: putative osmoprotectant transporter ATP-binding protein [Friedmanniella sp.]|nr:putative osmoprotectant transporter ATP-binding protein [Friedmanniella sp.]
MIQFESVGKTFRNGTAAVVDLDLTVPAGQVTAIVGPPGSGKTTTLQLVNRMLEPSKGRILLDGTPLKSRRRTALRRQLGYVTQSGGLFPHRTVLENIGTVPGLLRWSRDKTHKRSVELLGIVGLERKLAHRYPAQLTAGQQQRVSLARALAADPQVLLMDEPFCVADPALRAELHDFFSALQRDLGKTVLLVTHDIDEALQLGDQVAVLRVGGRSAQVGTPQQLLEEPADAFVEGFVGRDRGYRSLSYVSAGSLSLDNVRVVRDVEAATGDEPALVVDGDARPVGWADPARPGQLAPLGSTFDPQHDTLRTALDAALTSPHGLAVAVEPATGRFAGVVAAAAILSQATDRRAPSVAPVDAAESDQVDVTAIDAAPVDAAPVEAADAEAPVDDAAAPPADHAERWDSGSSLTDAEAETVGSEHVEAEPVGAEAVDQQAAPDDETVRHDTVTDHDEDAPSHDEPVLDHEPAIDHHAAPEDAATEPADPDLAAGEDGHRSEEQGREHGRNAVLPEADPAEDADPSAADAEPAGPPPYAPSQHPVRGREPADDRRWAAAFGTETTLIRNRPATEAVSDPSGDYATSPAHGAGAPTDTPYSAHPDTADLADADLADAETGSWFRDTDELEPAARPAGLWGRWMERGR